MFGIRNVSKQYGAEFALKDVSFKIGKGMNFIVGASGSGKTTLLKIMSGMERDFEGEVQFCGKDIKGITEEERSYFYNQVFGFVWQDFYLLEESTVLENVLLPTYLKGRVSRKQAEKILKDLKILELANKKVKNLSGGQKQRVAITRELMKDPQVIIADEPTSALDEKTSKTTMNLLRELSKQRTVIVVTHDTSMITEKDNVYELDKGQIVSATEVSLETTKKMKKFSHKKLSFRNAFTMAKGNIKNKWGRFFISALSLVVAGVLMLTTVSGVVSEKGQEEFNQLIEKYGEGVLDINVVSSFMSAGGTDGSEKEEPNADVSQDIGGVYEKYVKDERVEFTAFLQAFNDIKININGKNHSVQSSGNVPVVNKVISGKMPGESGYEVVVPESFATQAGFDQDKILGEELEFFSGIYNWDSGEPILKEAKVKAKVVGVIDTNVVYEYEGQVMEYSVDDAFFFSKTALDDMRKQAGFQDDKINLLIRTKQPSDMIAIKDELIKTGIVPLGRFELVEDMVRLEQQTSEQSGFSGMIIGGLSVVMMIAIFLITGLMRKREYGIYKVSGFHNKNLNVLNFAETFILGIFAVILMVFAALLFQMADPNLFGETVLNGKVLRTGVLLILLLTVISYFVTAICYRKTNVNVVLKSGDRS